MAGQKQQIEIASWLDGGATEVSPDEAVVLADKLLRANCRRESDSRLNGTSVGFRTFLNLSPLQLVNNGPLLKR